MPEGKHYQSLNKVLPFVALLIDQSMKYAMRAPMTRVDTRYSEIIADETGEMRYPVCGEEDQDRMKRKVKDF